MNNKLIDLENEAEEYATKQCNMYFTSKGMKRKIILTL